MLLKVAWSSLRSRKVTVLLTVFSIAVSVFLLLGVEHIRQEARSSFTRTVSGVDLIVGARTSPLNLLLYSVFRIGNATNNISWVSYEELAKSPQVAWTVPISLGDSHRGYRVMGTTNSYFEHYRYGEKRTLEFSAGKRFSDLYDLVLGSEVARKFNYNMGELVVVAHGTGKVSFSKHDDKPFRVTGILEPTGTAVDETLHVSLEAIEAIHKGWQSGTKLTVRSGLNVPAPHQKSDDGENAVAEHVNPELTPVSITAFMVGLKSKFAVFTFQRQVNEFSAEPLSAILPGAALSELWQMMSFFEKLLLLISLLVLFSSLLGMVVLLLATMRERQREMAIIRAVGGSPIFIFLLIQLEATLIVLSASVLGSLLLWGSLYLSADFLRRSGGIVIGTDIWNGNSLLIIGGVFLATSLLGLIPSVAAFRSCLHRGLTERG
ncbi:MAG: ABC transporter permease [bacterium]|nr:ABC transporter permease [bacterium]